MAKLNIGFIVEPGPEGKSSLALVDTVTNERWELAHGFECHDDAVDALIATLTAPMEVGELKAKQDEIDTVANGLADRIAELEGQLAAQQALTEKMTEGLLRLETRFAAGPQPIMLGTAAPQPPTSPPLQTREQRLQAGITNAPTIRRQREYIPHQPTGGAYNPSGRDIMENEGPSGLQLRQASGRTPGEDPNE